MQGGNPEFSQKFSEQIMNSALYRSAFCWPFSRQSVGVLILSPVRCRRVFKIHMQLALDHAVVQLAALIRLAAVARSNSGSGLSRYCLIGLFFVALPRSAYSFSACCKSSRRVRRIGKQYARIAVIALGRVRALEKHRVGYTGLARVLDGQLHAVRVDVAADDIEFIPAWQSSFLAPVARQTSKAPLLRISNGKETGRTALRDHGCLNRNRARAAERVEERVASAPARQLDHSRRQRLTERRRVAVGAVAAGLKRKERPSAPRYQPVSCLHRWRTESDIFHRSRQTRFDRTLRPGAIQLPF